MQKEYAALLDKRDMLWRKACAWEGISPDRSMVTFSENNPWASRWRSAELDLLVMNIRFAEAADRYK